MSETVQMHKKDAININRTWKVILNSDNTALQKILQNKKKQGRIYFFNWLVD
jgi:hypothetical protein